MKILFLSGASSIHTVRWVNALVKRGHEVHLVYLKQHMPQQGQIDRRVKHYVLPVPGNIGYYFNSIVMKKLFNMIQPDVVNAHYASGYGTLARMSRLKPLVLSVWGADVYDFPYQSKLKHNIIIKNLRYADKIASTSHVMAKQVRKLLCEDPNIRITPFGVDIERFQEKSHFEGNNNITIGIVKKLTPKYGIDYLIQAFKIVVDHYAKLDNSPALNLVIYGDGGQLPDLIELSRSLKVDRFVEFKGYIPNIKVPQALAEMDIFALSSILNSESFGVSAVEAMAAGLPVVATDADGFTEVVSDGETGMIVPKKDPEAMAKALQKLIDNRSLRIQFGKAGRKRAEELYDFKKNVQVMEELYSELIQKVKG